VVLQTYEQQELHTTGRKIRHDALPEHVGYEDTGCELSSTCLRCPLERCRYDQQGGVRRLRQSGRDETLRRFYKEGVHVDTLAATYGLTRRSVFRILAEK